MKALTHVQKYTHINKVEKDHFNSPLAGRWTLYLLLSDCKVLYDNRAGKKAGAGSNAHKCTHTNHTQGVHFYSGYHRFPYMVHTSSLAFDLRQINETNFLWMQRRITANMKAERERTETGAK